MGLRSKLAMSLMAVSLPFLVLQYYVLIPGLYGDWLDERITNEQRDISVFEKLFMIDAGKAVSVLIEDERERGVSYQLFDQNGNPIYETADLVIDNQIKISREVMGEGGLSYQLVAYVNVDDMSGRFNQIFSISIGFIIIMLVAAIFAQDRFTRQKLLKLRNMIEGVSKGEVEPKLSLSGDDEISGLQKGVLTVQSVLGNLRKSLEFERNHAYISLNSLRENQKKFESFYKSLPDGVLIVDDRGEIEVVNPALLKMTSFDGSELIGQHFDLLLPDHHTLLDEVIKPAYESSTKSERMVSVVNSRGDEFLASLSISCYMQGGDKHYVIVLRDNRERLVNEELLRDSEEKLRTIVENSANITTTLDAQNVITFLSPPWSDLLGYSISEGLGKKLEEFVYKEDISLYRQTIQSEACEHPPRAEFRIWHKDGDLRWFSGSGRRVCGEDGEAIFYVVVLEDITERKSALQALTDSEIRFRLLFESMSQGVVVIDQEGEQVISNNAAEKILGMSYQELSLSLTEGNIEILSENHELITLDQFPPHITMRTGETLYEKVIGIHSIHDEKLKWLMINSIGQISGDEALPSRIFITLEDMTDRRIAESAIQDYVRYLNVMYRINEIGLHSSNMNEMMKSVLLEILDIFGCKRAWFFHPCDTEQATLELPLLIDRSSPEIKHTFRLRMTEPVKEMLSEILTSSSTVTFKQGEKNDITDFVRNKYKVDMLFAVAIFPKSDKPWCLAMDFDEDRDVPSNQDCLILENIATRMSDYITSFHSLNNLRESEDSLKEAQQIGRIGNWSYDIKGGSVYWSEQVYRIMGKDVLWFTPEHDSFMDVIHPDDRERVSGFDQKIRRSGGKQSYDFRVVLPGEVLRWVHAEVVSDVPYGNNPSKIRGTFQDITQNKLSEEKLKRAENRMRMILESAAEGIFGLDSEGHATFVNPAAAEMLGYSSDEIVGQFIHKLIHHSYKNGEAYPVTECPFIQASLHGVLCKNDKEVLWRKDGRSFEVEYSAMPIRGDTQGSGAVVTFRDISDQLRVEEEKNLLQTQLQQAQKMDAIGQLTGGIAHDFNNMLASILGYSELSLSMPEVKQNEKLTHYLEEVYKAGGRGRDLIDKMLAFSRGVNSSKPEPVLIEPLLDDVLKMLRSVIPSSINIKTELEPGIPAAMIDTINLQQIIMNLCINARDAMLGKGNLNISVKRHQSLDQYCSSCHESFRGDFIELTVSDDGSGVNQENLSRMFDPFFTTKDVGKGTGMGLSVVHGVVHSAGGHVGVSSELDHGTSISIYLPSTELVVKEESKPQDSLPEQLHSGKILIVDDEPSVGEFLKEMLGLYGYECDYLDSPVKALDKVNQWPQHYQLLISDVTMPEMTGIELAESVKRINGDLPVVLCTGYSDKLTADMESEIGILCVLKKPLNSLELLEVVGGAMDEEDLLVS